MKKRNKEIYIKNKKFTLFMIMFAVILLSACVTIEEDTIIESVIEERAEVYKLYLIL